MKSLFFGSLLKLLLAAAIAMTLINDIGIIVTTYSVADDEAKRVAEAALETYRVNGSKDQAVQKAQLRASQDGARLTGFEITSAQVRVSIEFESRKTWVAHRISSLKPYLAAKASHNLPL